MAKRLWSSLAESTKQRYKRHGITAAMYNNPKRRTENADLFKTAQGKAPASYALQRARQLGILDVVPDINMLPRKEQARIVDSLSGELKDRAARDAVKRKALGYGVDHVTPWGSMNGEQQFQASELWNRVMDTKDGRTGHLTSRNDFEYEKLQFLGYLDEQGMDTDIEDWQFFRELYRNSF